MSSMKALLPYAMSCMTGMALWFGASFVAGRREAWDSPFYWSVAYPVALLISCLMGYLFPKLPWCWPLALFISQFVAMVIRNGELGSLWSLGMVLFAVLSIPAVLLALFMSLVRNRFSKKAAR